MKQTMSEDELAQFGVSMGGKLRGGECLELIGDVGAGKTFFTKALAKGMGITEDVQSPTFTLSRIYEEASVGLHHYDFYRLSDPGVMSYELAESLADKTAATVVEWADTVHDVLPTEHIVIRFSYTPDGEARIIEAIVPENYRYLI